MSLSDIPRPLRAAVFNRDKGICGYCRLLRIGQACVFHINHILPRSRGGNTVLDNLALQCPHRSLHKSNRISAIDPVTNDLVPLFHLLIQNWNANFRLTESGDCIGQSAVGRATVNALQMNASLPRIARVLQIEMGLSQI